jgi:L-alanine-DL-glutamate epimerase-like enolase superfamily enzyme
MRIVAIREKTVALSSTVRNASIGFDGMTASAVAIVTDVMRDGKPVVGFAFDSVGRYGHGGLLRERFIPRVLAADPEDYLGTEDGTLDPFGIWRIAMRDEKPGGHGERPGAVGLIDAAAWDLAAKLEDKPLWRVLAERFGDGVGETRVPVYASGGHYHADDDLARLGDNVRRCVALGYRTVKIKAGGAPISEDLRRIDTALEALEALGGGGALAVDLNGVMLQSSAEAFIDAVADRGLAWIEEPVDPLDFEAHKALAVGSPMPLATGENIFSAADTLNLVRYAGLRPDRDLLQVDVSLSYGIVEYLRILEVIEAHGWSRRQCLPHAGHLLAFNVAAGLKLGGHETGPLGNFPLGLEVSDGRASPGDAPGVGFEHSASFAPLFGDLVT